MRSPKEYSRRRVPIRVTIGFRGLGFQGHGDNVGALIIRIVLGPTIKYLQ